MSIPVLQETERIYDKDSDRLFLVYYPIIPGFNANKWGVSERSIDANIHTAINKPVIIYRKNPHNPFHSKQAGMYVHPTPEEASSELGKINAEQYYNWQEKFAVGRVRNVEKRNKGYAFTLEITDPDSKQILKSDKYKDGIPGYTSPQILSKSGAFPQEEQTNYFDHWVVSHIALVDVPAYGYDQAGVRAKCLGPEQECMITTRSASQENLGFCVKQATIDLVNAFSGSSQSSQTKDYVHTQMSSNENTSPSVATGTNAQEVVKYSTPIQDTQISKASDQPRPGEEAEKRPQESENPPNNIPPQEPNNEPQAKSLDEANAMLKQQAELIKELQKNFKTQGKELEQIRTERKFARLSYIIPRDLFKSDESHRKEVEKMMTQNISEEWIAELWKAKREAALASQAPQKMEQPLVAKSASVHEVPNYEQENNSSQNTSAPSIVQKQMELQKMILDAGGSN